MTGLLFLLTGAVFVGVGLIWWFMSPSVPLIVTPCPYCGNLDRLDNGNVVAGGLDGACEFNSRAIGMKYPPCITDQWWNERFG